ncbi:translation initiation factor if-2-related [Holotrichia oblita]|nr:translation initiation factor if-2-related [Holotrichia oblita]
MKVFSESEKSKSEMQQETAADTTVAVPQAQPVKILKPEKPKKADESAVPATPHEHKSAPKSVEVTHVEPLIDKPKDDKKVFIDKDGKQIVRKFITERVVPQRPAQRTPLGGGQRPAYGGGQTRNPAGRPQQSDGHGGGFNRPQGTSRQSGTIGGRPAPGQGLARFSTPLLPAQPAKEHSKNFANKNKTPDKGDSKKQMSQRTLIKKGFVSTGNALDYDSDFVTRKLRGKKESAQKEQIKIERAVVNTQQVPLKILSEKIGVPAAKILSKLISAGIETKITINSSVDFDYAASIADEFGVVLELQIERTFEEKMIDREIAQRDIAEDMHRRPPIVTVLGHVDHGKTSLLDAIRKTSVTAGEAGGITQHIGAYTVKLNNEQLTFIDTPGHEAFTAMRARGAQITDIAILVVAADDGVMPQTIEALNHAKAAGVPIVVAVNKIDKPEANPDRVKQQLNEHGILPEEWGGDAIFVPVSAKTRAGIDKLLEAVLLVAEVLELKANSSKQAKGTIIESKLDKGRGPVATVLVQNGTLRVGDNVVAGVCVGKVRAMFNDKQQSVKEAGLSSPVEILGFSEVPSAGDAVYAVDEKLAKQVADERKVKEREDKIVESSKVSLDDIFGKINEGKLKSLNVIIKTDVQGSLEALKGSLVKIANDEVRVTPIHGGVGGINESDIMLAKASGAIIIGFNVRADSNAKIVAEKEQIDIRLYSVIYDAVDDITKAMKGMLKPKFEETLLGQAEVRETFRITGVGVVAGCYVTSGKILRNCKLRVYRDNVIAYEGTMLALKRFKEDVKEVAAGFECGISIQNFNDIKVGDVFEAYKLDEVERRVKDPRLTEMYTLTGVKTDTELSTAKVFVSIFSTDEKKAELTLKAIKDSAGLIRQILSKEMHIRSVPKFEFVLDKQGEHSQRIEQILSEISKKD